MNRARCRWVTGWFGCLIARTIAFLLSDDSSFVTGSGLVVDGGMTTRLF